MDIRHPLADQGPLGLDQAWITIPVHVVVRPQDEHRLTRQLPCQKVEELHRGGIRPVECLQRHDQRCTGSVRLQELGEVPEDASLELSRILPHRRDRFGGVAFQSGEEVADLRVTSSGQDGDRLRIESLHDREERIGEEGVGRSRFHLIGLSRRHGHLCAPGFIDDRADETGFSDSPVSGEYHGPTGSGSRVSQSFLEQGLDFGPADHG